MPKQDAERPIDGRQRSVLEQRWAALRRRLDEAAQFLDRHGSIASRRARGERVWSVRYFESLEGRRIQRAIYVGSDPELIRRTALYLADLRAESEWLRCLPGVCRMTRGLVRRLARRRKVS